MGNNQISILGAGESGVGAAILAKKKGFEVFVSDSGKIKEKYRRVLSHHEIKYEEGRHNEKIILNSSEVIKSPGIPDHIPFIERIKENKIPVISEIEFADRFTDAVKVCITGSNGKTTTTLLTYHILNNAGLNVGLAGNVGNSFAWQVAENQFDYYIIELSSFQLDGMFEFKADIAVLLNITPDHLDRYNNNFQDYVNSKFRITNNQTERDAFIYCLDDTVIQKELQKRRTSAKQYPFTLKEEYLREGAFIKKDRMIININSTELDMTLEKLALQGKHNIYNSMAASIASRLLDIRKDKIKQSLSDFQNIEHRLEYVGTIHGVDFINDSKATNVNSTWYALESMSRPVVWIAGGTDKGNDYSLLRDVVASNVKAIVCLGKDNARIHRAFSDLIPDITNTKSAPEAVNAASRFAKNGDVVLLSPACASFDLFENYEDRGNKFKKSVKEL